MVRICTKNLVFKGFQASKSFEHQVNSMQTNKQRLQQSRDDRQQMAKPTPNVTRVINSGNFFKNAVNVKKVIWNIFFEGNTMQKSNPNYVDPQPMQRNLIEGNFGPGLSNPLSCGAKNVALKSSLQSCKNNMTH